MKVKVWNKLALFKLKAKLQNKNNYNFTCYKTDYSNCRDV
jgi:hypothetical protein